MLYFYSACMAISSFLVIGFTANGQELPEHFHPVKPNAMGGAFTAVANDENAVWTNPAGAARVRKARSRSTVSLVRFPNLIVGANTEGRAMYSGITGAADEAELQAAISEKELADKPFWAMGSAFPMMMLDVGSMPGTIGAFTQTVLKAKVDPDDTNQTDLSAVSDVGGLANLTWTNRTNRFSAGMQIRSIARYAYEDTIDTILLKDSKEMQKRLKNDANKLAALAVDVGTIMTYGDFWFPTVGIAIFNVPLGCKENYLNPFSKLRETTCGTVYKGDIVNEDAPSTIDPTDIRMGASITPRLTRKIALRLAVDVHHFHVAAGTSNYGYSGVETLKTLHAGAELFWGNPLLPPPFSISAGLSQGYYTMGASVRLGFLALDIATFGRDVSNSSTPVEDRRVLGGLSLDF